MGTFPFQNEMIGKILYQKLFDLIFLKHIRTRPQLWSV